MTRRNFFRLGFTSTVAGAALIANPEFRVLEKFGSGGPLAVSRLSEGQFETEWQHAFISDSFKSWEAAIRQRGWAFTDLRIGLDRGEDRVLRTVLRDGAGGFLWATVKTRGNLAPYALFFTHEYETFLAAKSLFRHGEPPSQDRVPPSARFSLLSEGEVKAWVQRFGVLRTDAAFAQADYVDCEKDKKECCTWCNIGGWSGCGVSCFCMCCENCFGPTPCDGGCLAWCCGYYLDAADFCCASCQGRDCGSVIPPPKP